ncbi:hypothetical protein BS78_03G401200 [Paspalum vaginatum]|nr:hypothetical protein BS78_03G401200 [Paspalum vaginatum]
MNLAGWKWKGSRVRVLLAFTSVSSLPSELHLLACVCTSSEAEMSGGGLRAGFSYQKFVHFALEQTRLRTTLVPHPSQVLDFAGFLEPEYDLPIFCANAFTSPARSIVVLDLNPLYDTTERKDYREKYYKNLMHLIHKYTELLPWGGKITSESLRFFSPAVVWTIFEPTEANHQVLYSAFMDYYKVWLQLVDEAVQETSKEKINLNREAQHKYLTWRAEKDPGYPLLKKLLGESLAKDLVEEFLFEGVGALGTKSFLDYFPEYTRDDGTVNKKRSMVGKSFETRPWDARGEFVGVGKEG